MSKCKLYYRTSGGEWYLGSFPTREKAQQYWSLVKTILEDKLGTGLEPIYVESGKGRGNK